MLSYRDLHRLFGGNSHIGMGIESSVQFGMSWRIECGSEEYGDTTTIRWKQGLLTIHFHGRYTNINCSPGNCILSGGQSLTFPYWESSAFCDWSTEGMWGTLTVSVHYWFKNWTGRSDDERIALTPIQVELPRCSNASQNKVKTCMMSDNNCRTYFQRYASFLSLPNLQCRHIHAGANRSEIFFSTDFPLIKKNKREWDLVSC